MADTRIVVASDVDNPLLGPNGAAAVYGPQKGASPDDVATLDAALAHWADVVDAATGRSARPRPARAPGPPAASATRPWPCSAPSSKPGIGLILDLVGFADHLPGARLVITGEGSLDEQTLHGKAPAGVAAAAAKAGVPVVTVSGRLALDRRPTAGGRDRGRPTPSPTSSPTSARCLAEAGRCWRSWPRSWPATGSEVRTHMTITVPLFVNGGGMRGGNVHYSIEGLPFLGEARTAPRYRFFSIRDEFPGLWPVAEGGVSVPGELYDVPLDVIRDRFIPAEPPELELSVIELDDGSSARRRRAARGRARRPGTGLTDISEPAAGAPTGQPGGLS